jgi:hypothetical protein
MAKGIVKAGLPGACRTTSPFRQLTVDHTVIVDADVRGDQAAAQPAERRHLPQSRFPPSRRYRHPQPRSDRPGGHRGRSVRHRRRDLPWRCRWPTGCATVVHAHPRRHHLPALRRGGMGPNAETFIRPTPGTSTLYTIVPTTGSVARSGRWAGAVRLFLWLRPRPCRLRPSGACPRCDLCHRRSGRAGSSAPPLRLAECGTGHRRSGLRAPGRARPGTVTARYRRIPAGITGAGSRSTHHLASISAPGRWHDGTPVRAADVEFSFAASGFHDRPPGGLLAPDRRRR